MIQLFFTFACFAVGIVCLIVVHDNKIKSGLLALNVLLSVMIPFISVLISSPEDRFSQVRRDFRRIVAIVFATSLEENVAYINMALIIIYYWNVKKWIATQMSFQSGKYVSWFDPIRFRG